MYWRVLPFVMFCLLTVSVFAAPSGKRPATQPAAKLAGEIHARIGKLLSKKPDPLFARHLRSIDALVAAEIGRMSLSEKPDAKARADFMKHAGKIRAGLDGQAGTWAPYAAGERSLVFAFVSGYDRTLQLYTLTLPRDYDPGKTYPLLVYLHGYTPNPHPLWFAGLPFGPDRKTPAKPSDLEPHFSLGPWGRGNTRYEGAGETDVWEAIADVEANFKTDADRTTLCGHSMGGFATWAIGLWTPDRWAALGIYSGGDRYAPIAGGVAVNGRNLPVQIWHGGKDRSVPAALGKAMAKALADAGGEPELVIDPEAGHMIPRPARAGQKAWLLKHTRTRPKTFTFVADSSRHTGTWGVTLRRDETADPLPRFTCKVEGNVVAIASKGTTGLQVVLGEGGLGLSGEVTVTWNGKQAYKGSPRIINLGDGVRPLWRRKR